MGGVTGTPPKFKRLYCKFGTGRRPVLLYFKSLHQTIMILRWEATGTRPRA